MILEQQPKSSKVMQFPPPGGQRHKVQTNENWDAIAKSYGLETWNLIEYNFPAVKETNNFDIKCQQVNWMLRTHVGCQEKFSKDGKNYLFNSSDAPGLIYLPPTPDNLIANLIIRGTPVPEGIPVWSSWDPKKYQVAVRHQLQKLLNSTVGRCVLTGIRRNTLIKPLVHYRDFLPVYIPVEHTVHYNPGVFIEGSRSYIPTSRFITGATADAALLHELVHAMRHTHGKRNSDREVIEPIHYPPWAPEYKSSNRLLFGTVGEFNAIVITNIYLSEVNPSSSLTGLNRDMLLLVMDHDLLHSPMRLAVPHYFHKHPKVRHYLLKLWREEPELCQAIAMVKSKFNPIRDVERQKA